MKIYFTLILACFLSTSFAQYVVKGTLRATDDGQPLVSASIKARKAGTASLSDANGNFNILIYSKTDTLLISMLGFKTHLEVLQLPLAKDLAIQLEPSSAQLNEVVVSTGYYQTPKERATGSFTQIGQNLINRSVSTNILDRLEGMASGLQFERTGTLGERGQEAKLRLRGISTIYSESKPLIVVNNFPFEGNINEINPNDVESVTLLKDAAAASIWGARAANGVLVITTKTGHYQQATRINFVSNVNIGERPDLHYSRAFIPSADWLAVEGYLFTKGYYDEDPNSPLPPYVELLIKQRDGKVSPTEFEKQQQIYAGQDIRRQASRYLYQNSVNQQYAFNVSGGNTKDNYYISAGHDNNSQIIKGDKDQRNTLSINNQLKLMENLSLTTGIYYSQTRNQQNGITLTDIKPNGFGLIPYTQLADEQGNVLPVLKDYRWSYIDEASAAGLLDWYYRPLDEQGMNDKVYKSNRVRLDAGLKYEFLNGWSAELKYQYQKQAAQRHQLYDKDSYYSRDLVNRFTQGNGSRVIPYGGILQEGEDHEERQYGRLQLNYQHVFASVHHLVALAGIERREELLYNGPGYQVYNYNEDVLSSSTLFDYSKYYPTRPQGSARIPYNPYNFADITDRNLSYFANVAYSFQERYTLSASSRWDGSNLFGVKANQKGVPLWSVGGAWTVSKEEAWKSRLLPYLRLRGTFGYNGNVNRQVSAYPTFQSALDGNTGFPFGIITNPGNPSLRWEKVRVFNVAVDLATKNKRLSGSIEYYQKQAGDLIGEMFMDPTTGLSNIRNRVNYAGMLTKGFDIDLSSINLQGAFSWQTNFLLSHVKNKVSNYKQDAAMTLNTSYLVTQPIPEEGTSLDALYALPWQGLSPVNGQVQVLLNDNLSQDYTSYLNGLSRQDITMAGVTVPTWYGGIRNTFAFKSFSLSANVTWKTGYVFRRSSINYNQLLSNAVPHIDYLLRWQHPGNELQTTVPSLTEELNNNREQVYAYSKILVEKGDHIRLQDVQMSYTLNQRDFKKMPFKSVRLSIYANNLGILWRANKYRIDPDYAYAAYPASKSIAFGLNVGF